MGVNYIKHLEAVFEKISLDDRLSTVHLGLYYSLFHQWNSVKFLNPISICRSELMRTSKIGSANTYTRCLRELHAFGYIEYKPSHNPNRGSLVNLYRFDTTTDKSSDMSTDTSPVRAVRPSINNINNKKPNKPLKQEEANSFRRPNPEREVQQDKGKGKSGRFAPPPSLDEIKEFFLSNGSYGSEAESFFDHFQSNGWLVGGKAKMKDWNAAARNWIKRSANFKTSSTANDRLNTNNNKDYSIPL